MTAGASLEKLKCLKLVKDRVRVAYFEPTAFFQVDLGNGAVIDDHRIAAGPYTETAIGQVEHGAHFLGQRCAAISEHLDLAGRVLILAPGIDDEYVVHRQACNGVNALGLDRIGLSFQRNPADAGPNRLA